MFTPPNHRNQSSKLSWFLILFAFSGSLLAESLPVITGETLSGFSLQPARLDLGAVGHGGKYPNLSFKVTNNTNTTQTFTIRPSCGCMKLKGPSRLTLDAGATQEIGFQLTLGRGWGVFAKRIDLVDGNRRVLASFPVNALFHPGVKIAAMEAVLTTSPVSTLPESKTRIDFIGTKKIPVLSDLKSEDPRIEFGIIPSEKPGVATLEIRSLSNWPSGRFSTMVTGLCNGLPFKLPVRGRAFGSLIHEPHSWNLKQIRNVSPSPETLILRRADGKPLEILEMQVEWLRPVDGFDVTLSQETLKDGSVKITATPVDPIPKVNKGFYGKVVLTTNVEEEPTVRVDLLGVTQIPRKATPR
ncbi:MAG: hypothetical protein ACPG1Z_08815 [Planctomycetota bacterium]